MSKYGVFLVCVFPYPDWMRRFTSCFPVFRLTTEIYFVNLLIQSKYGKIQTRKTPYLDTFYAVYIVLYLSLLCRYMASFPNKVIVKSSVYNYSPKLKVKHTWVDFIPFPILIIINNYGVIAAVTVFWFPSLSIKRFWLMPETSNYVNEYSWEFMHSWQKGS